MEKIGSKSFYEKLGKVEKALFEEYGYPEPPNRPEPVKSLIRTILSQNTNDRNRDIAAERLFEKFPTTEEILEADLKDVEEAVRPAGLGKTKAGRIQNFLRLVKEEKGEITLDHVVEMDKEEAKSYLQKFDGIGPKTAAVTLLFVFGKPVMPVDTHVHRLSKRIGLIPEKTSRKKAHDILEEVVDDEKMYRFHINLIKHGRSVCKARKPLCEKCVLKGLCDYYKKRKEGLSRSF